MNMWGKKKTEKTIKQSTSGTSFSTQTSTTTVGKLSATTKVVSVRQLTTSSSIQSSHVTHETYSNSSATPRSLSNTIWNIPSLPGATAKSTFKTETDARPFISSVGTTSMPNYQSPFNRRLVSYSSTREPAAITYQSPVPATYQSPYNRRATVNSTSELQTSTTPSTLNNSTVSLPTNINQERGDNLTYDTKGAKRGKVLIINNIKFLEEKAERKGAEKDEQNLRELFRKIGFEVTSYHNLKKLEMVDRIKKFRTDKSLAKSDMAILVIMSHGHNVRNNQVIRGGYTEIIGTDDNGLEVEDVLNEFSAENCSYLKGKPKIFIFQCCRGNRSEIPHADAVPITKVVKNLADMLIAHSTLPGFVSLRNPQEGSWYIQSICKVFKKYAKDWDIETMLKIVDQELSTQHPNYKQTSSYESRGFNKRCFLNPINPL